MKKRVPYIQPVYAHYTKNGVADINELIGCVK